MPPCPMPLEELAAPEIQAKKRVESCADAHLVLFSPSDRLS